MSSHCEKCDGNRWGGVFKFFFTTTMMAVFFDFKARKLNVEEEGGAIFFRFSTPIFDWFSTDFQ